MPIIGITSNQVLHYNINRDRVWKLILLERGYRRTNEVPINDALTRLKNTIRKVQYKMPKKTTKNKEKYEWKGYVNVNIPTEAIPDVELFISDEKEVFQSIVTALSQLNTMKVYYDDKQDSFKCTLMSYEPDSPNYGHAMSGYGSDWYTAVAVTLYKHFTICNCDWSIQAITTGRSFG